MSPYTPNIFFSEITEELNKIKIGQKVLISLKEYPQNSYGTWDGIIKSISSSPDAIFYKVKIELSPYSVSTKGNELPPVSYAVWGTAVYNGDNKSFLNAFLLFIGKFNISYKELLIRLNGYVNKNCVNPLACHSFKSTLL